MLLRSDTFFGTRPGDPEPALNTHFIDAVSDLISYDYSVYHSIMVVFLM